MIASLRFTFSTQTAAPPANTQLRLDAGPPFTAVTRLLASHQTDDGMDAFYLLHRIAVDDTLVLQDVDDHTRALRLVATGDAIDRGSYCEVAVRHDTDSGVGFANNQDVLLFVLSPVVAPEPEPPSTITWPLAASTGWLAPNVSVLVTPPTLEPLTLDEAKLRAGLDWVSPDPRDAQMEGFIRAARERVERDTGWALLTQTRDVYLSHATLPAFYPGPARPVQSDVPIDPPQPLVYPWARRLVVGWTTVAQIPPSLLFAVGLLTAHYATAARDAVVVGTILQAVPLGYEDAIADFRQVAV